MRRHRSLHVHDPEEAEEVGTSITSRIAIARSPSSAGT